MGDVLILYHIQISLNIVDSEFWRQAPRKDKIGYLSI
jgi:hypothetical protein